jgi:hypothetical protein
MILWARLRSNASEQTIGANLLARPIKQDKTSDNGTDPDVIHDLEPLVLQPERSRQRTKECMIT